MPCKRILPGIVYTLSCLLARGCASIPLQPHVDQWVLDSNAELLSLCARSASSDALRCTTDTDKHAGVERLAVSSLRPDLGLMPPVCLDITDVSKDVDKGMLPPHSVFLVKGWTRSVCANTILACCWEMSEFLEAGLQDLEPLMFLARLCRHSQKRSKSFPAVVRKMID